MGLTKKQLKDAEAAVAYFSKIGKKEGWVKQKDIDEAKQAIKVMKGGRRKSKKSRKSRSRRGGAKLGEGCKSSEYCDGDLICNDGVCSQPPSLGEVATMLQGASDNAGIPRDFQMGANDIPNSGGSIPYANDRGAQMVNNTLNHTQQLIQHAAGRGENDIYGQIIASGNTEMMKVFLADRNAQRERDHEFRMKKHADKKAVVEDIVQKNQEVALDRNKTQLALYNTSQRTNRMNTNFHLALQFIILGIVTTIAMLAYNTGDVFAQLFRDIDSGVGQRLNITVPSMDTENAQWWTMGVPHLINLFVAILQGAVDLGRFFLGALTQFLATLAALGPAGMAAGIMFCGILFMIAIYLLMNIRRARGFFAIGGIDLNIGEQQGAQALPQLAQAQPQQTHGVLSDLPTRVEGMIRNGQGRLTDGEERLLLRNRGGNGSSASGSGGSDNQLRLRNRSSGNDDESNTGGSKETKGGRRKTRRRRRKKRKTKRKKRRGRRKSKRRRRRKSRR